MELEISEKQKILNQIDNQIEPYNQKELNLKLDFVLNNLNKKSNENNTLVLFLIILIATLVIIYFIYKATYYIQPDNLANAFGKALGYSFQ